MAKKLNKEQRRYIRENYNKLSIQDIAKKLGVSLKEVQIAVKEMELDEKVETQESKYPLHRLVKEDFLWGLPVPILCLIVYALTFCRTLYVGDSGEFGAMGYTLGIAHPPGYPTWVMLLKIAAEFLPFEHVAGRCNFMASIIAACATYALYLLVIKASGNRIAAIIASLMYGFAYQFWSQAMIAEVYVMNAFFIGITTFLLLMWSDHQENRYLYLLYLLTGLAMTNHNTFLAMPLFFSFFIVCSLKKNWGIKQEFIYIAIFFVFVLFVRAFIAPIIANGVSFLFLRQELPKTDTFLPNAVLSVIIFLPYTLFFHWWHQKNRVWLYALFFFILGAMPYLFLPMRDLSNPQMSWGFPHTLEEFYNHISRRQYGPLSDMPRVFPSFMPLLGPWDLVREQVESWLMLTLRQFGSYLGPHIFTSLPLNHRLFSPEIKNPALWYSLIGLWTFGWISVTLLGMWTLLKRNLKFFLFTILSFLLYGPGLIGVLNFNTTTHKLYLLQVFLIPSYMMIAIWLGFGVVAILEWLKEKMKKESVDKSLETALPKSPIPVYSIITGILLLMPLVPLSRNWKDNDLSKNAIAYDFGMNIINSMEPNANVFIIGDNPTFSLGYLYYVENKAPNITIYDEGENLFTLIHDFGKDKYRTGPYEHNRLKDISRARICYEADRPVYFMTYTQFTPPPEDPTRFQDFPELGQFKTLPCGVLYKLIKPGQPEPDFEATIAKLRNLDTYFNDMSTDYYTRELVANYHFLIGRGYSEMADRKKDPELQKKAIAEYDRTSVTGWDLDNMHINLANFARMSGDLEKSVEEFQQAILVQPRKAMSYFGLADVYTTLGDSEKAIEVLKKGISLAIYDQEGNDPRAHFMLGNVIWNQIIKEIGDKDINSLPPDTQNKLRPMLREAITHFQNGLSREPRVFQIYHQLGDAYLLLKEYDNAVAMWNQALIYNPRYGPTLLRLAQFYKDTRPDPVKANEYFMRYQQSQGTVPTP